MDVGAQRLQPLLVGDAEALLLVDDDQAELPELDALGEERMGADDDVDLAGLEALLGRLRLGGGDEAREPADLDREALEALLEGLEMLAGEQGGRRDQRDLQPGHRGDEGGAQRDLGLAEADVAADQPVHRLARAEIVDHVGDGAVLVLGLLIGEAVDEGGIAGVGLDDRAGAQRALGRGLDQLAGDLADPLLHPRLAPLPGLAAEPVERRRPRCRCRSARGCRYSRPGRRACRRRHSRARRNRAAPCCTGIWVSPS